MKKYQHHNDQRIARLATALRRAALTGFLLLTAFALLWACDDGSQPAPTTLPTNTPTAAHIPTDAPTPGYTPTPPPMGTSTPSPNPTATPTPFPTHATNATAMPTPVTTGGPDAARTSTTELVARAKVAMALQSFRGGFAFGPSLPESEFTYVPGLTLLQDLGGEWHRYILLTDGAAFYSGDGARWLTSSEDSISEVFLSVISDPRVALRFAVTPEIVGKESVDGRTYLIVSTGLDAEAILDVTPPPQPHVRIGLGFPYPQGADARELEGLGYEVFGSLLEDSAVWEAFKGPYHLSFSESADRPGQPRGEWNVRVSVIVHDATALEAPAKQELRSVLKAYGADPDLIEGARVRPVVADAREDMRQQLQDMKARLWIQVETGLVRRLAIGSGSSDGAENVVGFWGYGDDLQLREPTDVMDARRADALNGIARGSFNVLSKALEYHETQHGRHPDALTPETVRDALEALGLTWPTNPFNGSPVRHAPGSPGDFRYTGYGNDYALEVHGWDLPLISRVSKTVASTGVEGTPDSNTLEQDLEYVRSMDFPVLWLGVRSSESDQNGVALPSLTLTEVAACPPEPACIWPVRFDYGTEEHGSRLMAFLERPRGEGDVSKGERTQIAGLEATMLVTKEPLLYRAELSVWRATIWLPESVVQVTATTITQEPEGNPFNSELGLTGTVRLLMELE